MFGLSEAIHQEVSDSLSSVGADESQRIQRPTFREWAGAVWRNVSTVVPACRSAFVYITALWQMLFRVSTDCLMDFKSKRKWRWRLIGMSPVRIPFSFFNLSQ